MSKSPRPPTSKTFDLSKFDAYFKDLDFTYFPGPKPRTKPGLDGPGWIKYESFTDLFRKINAHYDSLGAEPNRNSSRTQKIDLNDERQIIEHFRTIEDCVEHYMLDAEITNIYVAQPQFDSREGTRGSYGSDYFFITTKSAGTYFSIKSTGRPTLLDVYEDCLGEELKPSTVRRLAKHVTKSRKLAATLTAADSAYFASHLPPPNQSSAMRGCFDYLFSGEQLTLASLYYEQIAFRMPKLREYPGIDPREGDYAWRFSLLASIRPLLQRNIVFPVNFDFYSEPLMDWWIPMYVAYFTDYEDTYVKIVERVEGRDIRDSALEHFEVYAQSWIRSVLCEGHNAFADESFYLLTQLLAKKHNLPCAGPSGPNLGAYVSGLVLDNFILPSLHDCRIMDITALRLNGDNLAAFRTDLGKICNDVTRICADSSQFPEELPLMTKEFLRADSLISDVRSTSLSEHLKVAGLALSLGLATGFALGGDSLSGIASGVLGELLAAGILTAKAKKRRKDNALLTTLYSRLADAREVRSTRRQRWSQD